MASKHLPFALLPVAVAALCLVPGHVLAGNALGSAWNCAKSSAGGVANIGVDLAKKADAVASMGGELGVCLAKSGGDQTGFAITMGAITAIKIASPSSLPNGQCQSAIHGLLARPFAEGISVVMPASGAKSQLLGLINSPATGDALWQQFASLPPPIMTYASHVDCSCMLIDKAVSLADLSAVGNAISDVSDKCGAFLDDAGLGFINDYGSAAIEWTGGAYSSASGWWDRSLLGQSQHADPETVYQMYWRPYVVEQANEWLGADDGRLPWHPQSNVMADQVAAAGFSGLGSMWSVQQASSGLDALIKADNACRNGGKCTTSVGAIFDQCVIYYDDHTASKAHAQEWCATMRDQRFLPDAKKLAGEFSADIQTRLLVQERLDAEHKKIMAWQWRLPRRPGYQPGDKFNGWSAQLADNIALANLGHAQAFGAASRGPWDYLLSGVFEAAREVLPNVGWSPQQAAELAFKGIRPTIDGNLRKAWQDWSHWDATSRLGEWLPVPAFGGKYGCPNEGAPLASACTGKVISTYQKVCAGPVEGAHINAVDLPDLYGAGRRLDTVKKNCLSWIVPQIEKANILSQPSADIGVYYQEFCAALPTRSTEQENCQRRLGDAWLNCASEAYAAGQGENSAKQCLTDFAQAYRLRDQHGRRIEAKPQPGNMTAPKAGQATLPVVVPPAQETQPGSRSAPARSAPVLTMPPAQTLQRQGLRVAPMQRAAPAPPACAEGEVLVTLEDGNKVCEPLRRQRGS